MMQNGKTLFRGDGGDDRRMDDRGQIIRKTDIGHGKRTTFGPGDTKRAGIGELQDPTHPIQGKLDLRNGGNGNGKELHWHLDIVEKGDGGENGRWLES